MDQVTNCRGSALLIVVTILCVVVTLMTVFAQGRGFFLSAEIRERKLVSLDIAKNAMESQLSNNDTWKTTVERNESLQCLQAGNCTTLQKQPLNVFSLTGTSLSGETSAGYDHNGSVCDTPDQQCTLKYFFTWRPMCPSLIGCLNPTLEVVGELRETSLFPRGNLRFDRYKIVIYRNP